MATNGRRQIDEDEDIIDVDDSSLQTNQANYAWEEEYKRSWDVLQEDEHGRGKANCQAKGVYYRVTALFFQVAEGKQEIIQLPLKYPVTKKGQGHCAARNPHIRIDQEFNRFSDIS